MAIFDRSVVSRRALVALTVTVALTILVGWAVLHDDGMVGATTKNGFGCTCHDFQPSDSVHVWIEGPARVRTGSVASYALVMTGGPAVKGGYNVAAGHGSLEPGDAGSKTALSVDGLELTHSAPRAFAADTVRWAFLYHAPSDTSEDTLYSVGNSADGNGIPTGDLFNFGENFIVDLTADSVSAVADASVPGRFALLQNYPNPFNPTTSLRFVLERAQTVDLAVFDVRGVRVATIVSERTSPGVHTFSWDASGLSSGVYVARLVAGETTLSRKMLLMR
jgi:hypothetical protein